MSKDLEYEVSSGNVFADLDVARPDEALLKADLAMAIAQLIEQRGLTQKESVALLGETQPHVSQLLRGQLKGFSVERLMRFLVALGQEIEVSIRPRPADMPLSPRVAVRCVRRERPKPRTRKSQTLPA
jgi:predicted XRE-type DNA-binding protein